MIIDIHTHTFPARIAADTIRKLSRQSHTIPFTDGTAEGLRESNSKSGIDLAVILPVATSPEQVEKINSSAYIQNQNSKETHLVSFAAMHPDYAEYSRELQRCAERGFRGIKIHPAYQNADLDDIRYLRILDKAAELQLAVVTHSGLDVGLPGVVRCSPQMIAHVMREVPGATVIAAHMGGWKNWDEVPEYLAGTGVYLDTSFATGAMHPLDDGHYRPEDLPMLDTEQFMILADAFGSGRILFGTDRPWSDPQETMEFIRSLPLPEEEIADILGGNAERVLFGR